MIRSESERAGSRRGNGNVELLGAPKSGFKLSADVTPATLMLSSRLDPALLYLVVGAAVLLGLVGAALAAPARVVLEAGLFAALFSPIALFLVVSALRIRASCAVDLERGRLRLAESRYLGGWERSYRIEDVGPVLLLSTAPASLPRIGRNYLLCLALPDGAYLLGESPAEESLLLVGRLLAQFLGVPLERHEQAVVAAPGRRRFVVGALLYAVPVTAAVAALSISIPELGSNWVFPTTLAAIVLSQVGAILTLLYYRRRVPEGADLTDTRLPATPDPALPTAGPDRAP
jgi:hypothetical protein